MSLDGAVSKILQRAVELDVKQRYTEAIVCYQEGIQILIDLRKGEPEEKRLYLKNKIEEYMKRAEKLKTIINDLKEQGKYCEQIEIDDNSIGHSYENVFGRFLDDEVTIVRVEDPYVKMYYQCQNLLKLCELVVKKCKGFKKLELLTTCNNECKEQILWFAELKNELERHNVEFSYEFSTTLHDRQIILNTGWIIKLGRGLDYFKAPKSKFSIGNYDLDLRPCHQTTINIFHSKNMRQT